MGLEVLGPDVNESFLRFMVNKEGNIRFGLAAVKGVGEGAVEDIISEREANGIYKDVYDIIERINLKSVNKKVLESLALSGALDTLSDINRCQYVVPDEKGGSFIEYLIRYGNKYQEEKAGAQKSLFGGQSVANINRPEPFSCTEWSSLHQLNQEKELVGIYLSAHPLDEYKLEIDHFTNANLGDLQDLDLLKGKEIRVAGIVTSAEHKTTKNNKPYGRMIFEDFTDSASLMFFGKDYMAFKNYMQAGYNLYLSGKIAPRPFNEDELEFKVKEIKLLSEMRENGINTLTLKIPIGDINTTLIDEILGMAKKHKGNTNLKFLIYDAVDKIWVEMFSRKHRIELSPEFAEFVKNLSGIDYKID